MNMSFLRKRESGNLMKSGDIVGGRDAMMAGLKPRKDAFCRRSGERRNPVKPSSWIPAFAGMTDCSWPHPHLTQRHLLITSNTTTPTLFLKGERVNNHRSIQQPANNKQT